MIESKSFRPLDTSALEGQLRQIYARSTFVEKTHQKMADSCIARYKLIKVTEIMLSALTSTSLLASILGEGKNGTIVAALLSTVLLFFTLYFKEANLNERAQQHSEFGAKLWGLREQALSLLVDLQDGGNIASIRGSRDELNRKLEAAYKLAPRTDSGAYFSARESLKISENSVFSNDYINSILPNPLKRDNNQEPNRNH